MSSKKEEERNEKIIRGLMKLPPNRRCINCDSLGPQYVCTNFWTFICISCSGIHREFTHRVKSVSMAKFTSQEVEALQKGGNQRARELFLRDWDVQRTRLPDSSKPEKIREFIKNVYVDKKFGGSRSSDKPPRDTQNLKDHEDHRRASSYHSFSQSPPYEHQYEDRRYGKPTGMLSRKPGSDRGHSEGKVSSFMLSPGHLGEQMYEDKFANESYGSRISDYSVSSKSDPFRSDGQSPNFQDTGYSSPPLQQVRDMLIEDARPQTMNTNSEENIKRGFDGIPRPKSAASSESIGSSNGNPATNLGSLLDIVLEPEHAFGAQKGRSSIDPFGLPTAQQPTTSSSPSIDLFANVNHHVSSTIPVQKSSAVPFSEDVGWATFDLPYHVAPASKTNNGPPSMHPFAEGPPEGNIGANSSVPNSLQWSPVQNSATPVSFPLMADQWPVGLHEVKGSADPRNSQSWNAFDDFAGTVSHPSIVSLPQTSEAEILGAAFGDPYISSKVPEVPVENKFQELAVDDNTLGLSLPFDGVSGSSFPSFVLPLTGGTTREQKSINPFDLPYDSYSEANNVFLDMSSLQEAQLPTTFLGGLSQSWLNPITTFIPSMHQGQVPSSPPQGSVASLGGNPFA